MAQGSQRLTADDINSIYTPGNLYNPDNGVLRKLPAGPLRASHVVQCADFDRVFVTSDIHADFRKFIQLLMHNEMGNPVAYGGDIYDPNIIANAVWTGGRKTLLVIVGDLVDGQRVYGDINDPTTPITKPDDPRGSFEFLLHALIYNLRLSAREQGSEILFTIGNHDHHTVINIVDDAGMYDANVSSDAKRFFGNNADLRRHALLPFYKLSPYYILSLENGGTKEVAFVHGGLHSNEGVSNTAALITIQTVINGDIKMLNRAYDMWDQSQNDPLWARYYANGNAGDCDQVQGTGYKLIVVGHCPTNQFPRFTTLIQNKPHIYGNCDVRVDRVILGRADEPPETTDEIGCVMTDCENHPTMLAFVDVAMSQGQRMPENVINNAGRAVQMLVLTHIPTNISPYYGQIDAVNNGVITHLHIHDAAGVAAAGVAAAGGAGRGGYRRRRNKQTRKITRKKRLHRKNTHRRR